MKVKILAFIALCILPVSTMTAVKCYQDLEFGVSFGLKDGMELSGVEVEMGSGLQQECSSPFQF